MAAHESPRSAHTQHTRGGPRRRFVTALRHAGPFAAALALYLVLGGDLEPDADLQLQAPRDLPSTAESVPLRALLYTQLRRADGPSLVARPVAVRLETATGHVLSSAQLSASRTSGAMRDVQGSLPIPRSSPHALQIVADVMLEEEALQVSAALERHERLEEPAPIARSLRSVQQLAASPVHIEPGQRAPSALHVVVRGGACVPEQPCRLLVHVGAPAAALRVEPNSTLTPAPDSARESAVTSGVVALAVTTHGPEAELWLRVVRDGARVASRSVRLPVALAALSAHVDGVVFESSGELRIGAHAADGGCIIDAFRDGHWSATGSFEACAQSNALPFDLPRGLSRLQLRRDPFSAELAAVAIAYVRGPDESPAQVAAALALAARGRAPNDAFARACVAAPDTCVSQPALAYLAGVLEAGLMPLPRPTSAYAYSVARLRERRDQLFSLSVWALALGGVSLALSIGQSGVWAGARASRLLPLDPRAAARARVRSWVTAVLSACALLLVFVVLALYVLARGGY